MFFFFFFFFFSNCISADFNVCPVSWYMYIHVSQLEIQVQIVATPAKPRHYMYICLLFGEEQYMLLAFVDTK